MANRRFPSMQVEGRLKITQGHLFKFGQKIFGLIYGQGHLVSLHQQFHPVTGGKQHGLIDGTHGP